MSRSSVPWSLIVLHALYQRWNLPTSMIADMTKKRGYSDEFPTTREKRVYFMLDKIPPMLWIRVKAKAKREGVSLRALILGWCKEWVDDAR
jgi:hypothetical protein